MAVESDYNWLVFRLNDLADYLGATREEVRERLLKEKGDESRPNETAWVNYLAFRLEMLEPAVRQLHAKTIAVLSTLEGVQAFGVEEPELPNYPPPS